MFNQTCIKCGSDYPANRDNFPAHKGLAFKDRPCKVCRKKVYNRMSNVSRMAWEKVDRLKHIEYHKWARLNKIAYLHEAMSTYGFDEFNAISAWEYIASHHRFAYFEGVWYPILEAVILWLRANPSYLDRGTDIYDIKDALHDYEYSGCNRLIIASKTTVIKALRIARKS